MFLNFIYLKKKFNNAPLFAPAAILQHRLRAGHIPAGRRAFSVHLGIVSLLPRPARLVAPHSPRNEGRRIERRHDVRGFGIMFGQYSQRKIFPATSSGVHTNRPRGTIDGTKLRISSSLSGLRKRKTFTWYCARDRTSARSVTWADFRIGFWISSRISSCEHKTQVLKMINLNVTVYWIIW